CAGGSPAASHFFLLRQEKVTKKKATAKPLPSLRSGPQMRRVSVGWGNQLAALKHVPPQFPTDTRHIWQRPNADFKFKSQFKSNRNRKVKSNSLAFLPGSDLEQVFT
ncbi:hypothetical protein, partial [Collimonas sp. OK607]|uniref:hypothetical protein n=1 Tax=Collimonas sp. OK607 TaxID=1798194 RepID=UPI001B8BEBAB